jgi:hypothetical protein
LNKATWTGALETDDSPIKTRSARKNYLERRGDVTTSGIFIIEIGALRGIKSHTRDK